MYDFCSSITSQLSLDKFSFMHECMFIFISNSQEKFLCEVERDMLYQIPILGEEVYHHFESMQRIDVFNKNIIFIKKHNNSNIESLLQSVICGGKYIK